jgi:hypothetical protein
LEIDQLTSYSFDIDDSNKVAEFNEENTRKLIHFVRENPAILEKMKVWPFDFKCFKILKY